MGKKQFPENPYARDLEKGQKADGERQHQVDPEGCLSKAFRPEGSHACQNQPAENNQADGDFIPVKLAQEFSNGEDLGGNGRNADPDDGSHRQPTKMAGRNGSIGGHYSSKAWTW
jgi:hypothetical protein